MSMISIDTFRRNNDIRRYGFGGTLYITGRSGLMNPNAFLLDIDTGVDISILLITTHLTTEGSVC